MLIDGLAQYARDGFTELSVVEARLRGGDGLRCRPLTLRSIV
jgi:hypothetical protein